MPYASVKQRRYLHAKHPGIAARWDRKYGGKIRPTLHRSLRKKGRR